MGCSSSVSARSGIRRKPSSIKQKSGGFKPLNEFEIAQRIVAPVESLQSVIGGAHVRYAWVSQRGYYPEG
jgi:hypothetical protein